MSPMLEQRVRRRARFRCEYCLLPATAHQNFEIDHIIATQHHGKTTFANLALACYACNRQKGPNLAGIDPLDGRLCRLFNPRLHHWNRHFRWQGATLRAKTAIGRVTLYVLDINHPLRVAMRRALMLEHIYFQDVSD